MMENNSIHDKRDRARLFRERLSLAMEKTGSNRSSLARAANVDRSTISQILLTDAPRLPNAQLAAECAIALGVSTDWLLGLTERPERPGDVIDAAMRVTDTDRSATDEQLLEWHREASGYKLRHVPATLPDMLKTEAVLHWEYSSLLSRTAEQAVTAMRDRLQWMRESTSDYEVCMPIHELDCFASGQGYWKGLPAKDRREQLDYLARLCREIYPALRIHLFDAHHQFSAPITVFGPLMAVIYTGRHYLAFRESSRVALLTRQFDWLVREAIIDPRQLPDYLDGLEVRDDA